LQSYIKEDIVSSSWHMPKITGHSEVYLWHNSKEVTPNQDRQ